MVGILVFANWGKPEEDAGLLARRLRRQVADHGGVLPPGLGVVLVAWFGVSVVEGGAGGRAGRRRWPSCSRTQPMIPFVGGVVGLVARHQHRPRARGGEWFAVDLGLRQADPAAAAGRRAGRRASCWAGRAGGRHSLAVGQPRRSAGTRCGRTSSPRSSGAFMYFATLTEVPILQGLIGSGMGKGPALALLLAGPALSLPSMLVLRSIMGAQKTVVYCSLVVVMATITGMIYGAFLP